MYPIADRGRLERVWKQYFSILIGDRKDSVCLLMCSLKSTSRRTANYAMLDPKGRAFVLIQVLYSAFGFGLDHPPRKIIIQ